MTVKEMMSEHRYATVILSTVLILMIADYAKAYSLEYGVFDINTQLAINQANVTIYNITSEVLIAGQTDTSGYVLLDFGNYSNISVKTQKLGYLTDTSSFSTTTSFSETIYLMPVATNGRIKLTITDYTFGSDRQLCFYFAENGRLYGCWKENETVIILTNRNYTIVPKIQKGDIFASPQNMINWSYILGPYVFGFAVIVVIFAIAFYYIFIYKGRKKE